MKNQAEAATMCEFANDLYQKAEWHQKQSQLPQSGLAMADAMIEHVFNKLKAEIFADIARSAQETADRISK